MKTGIEVNVVGSVEFEEVGTDGVLYQVQVGTDIKSRIIYKVGQDIGGGLGLRISSIRLDRAFMDKFGKPHIRVLVWGLNKVERIYLEIVDETILTHDMREGKE